MAENLGALRTEQVNPNTLNMDCVDEEGFVTLMAEENFVAAQAVRNAGRELALALRLINEKIKKGGRLIYCGAGTSGRLGVLDASECPPTFGVDNGLVVGVMAGGDRALRFSSESTEDSMDEGIKDMKAIELNENDALVAIAASGRTPYCIGALRYAEELGAAAIALVCNPDSKMQSEAELTIVLDTGAEALTGSTRLKAGTATKMVLNALSTGAMVAMGKTYQNLMVDMRATNEKLKNRAVRMLMTAIKIKDRDQAAALLASAEGNVKAAIVMYETGVSYSQAMSRLDKCGGFVRAAIKEENQ